MLGPGRVAMPYQPTNRSTVAFLPSEWDLLVRLPGRVLVAATSAGRDSAPDSAAQTVADGLAGIEAIAAGRGAGSRLVREVVAAIYAERDADDDLPIGTGGVLAECRVAARTV